MASRCCSSSPAEEAACNAGRIACSCWGLRTTPIGSERGLGYDGCSCSKRGSLLLRKESRLPGTLLLLLLVRITATGSEGEEGIRCCCSRRGKVWQVAVWGLGCVGDAAMHGPRIEGTRLQAVLVDRMVPLPEFCSCRLELTTQNVAGMCTVHTY